MEKHVQCYFELLNIEALEQWIDLLKLFWRCLTINESFNFSMLECARLAKETFAAIRWCTSLTVNRRDLKRRQKYEREREREKLALPIMK